MRFLYDRNLQKPVKIQRHIDFDKQIDLRDFSISETATHYTYELFAVVDRGRTET